MLITFLAVDFNNEMLCALSFCHIKVINAVVCMQLILESAHSWIRQLADGTLSLARHTGELFVMCIVLLTCLF